MTPWLLINGGRKSHLKVLFSAFGVIQYTSFSAQANANIWMSLGCPVENLKRLLLTGGATNPGGIVLYMRATDIMHFNVSFENFHHVRSSKDTFSGFK